MKAFVTGATGFLGGALARQLRVRGDEVVSLVRSPRKAGGLRDLDCEIVEGDLRDVDVLRRAVKGTDAVFHSAAMYEIGVPRSWRPRMFDANVGGAEHVLDAAIEARVPRIVHVSTINVYGDSRGIVRTDESLPDRAEFLSVYDETKYLAHRVALQRIEDGAPVTIVCPGAIYGPADPSELGKQIRLIQRGKRQPVGFAGMGLNVLHVEDAAAGLLLAHDRGNPGQTYVLGGEITTLGDLLGAAARILGRKPPRTLPTWAIRLGIPFGPLVGKLMGVPPNLRELVRLSDGVTYWASDQKAREDLGYAPRDLETGLRQTVAA